MGYDAHEDTYATSCDEFSDSESELSSVEQLFKGYEPALVVLDGSDHALFGQIDQLIDCLRASKLIQQIRVSTAFLQGLDVVDDDDDGGEDGDDEGVLLDNKKKNNNNDKKKCCPEANALFDAIAGLAPICEIFICHLHRHLPRTALQQEGGGLMKCVQSISHLTLNNFLLTEGLIAALGANPELRELRAYVDTTTTRNEPQQSASIINDGLNPLFMALAKSPTLRMLDIYAKEDERPEQPRRLTADALTALLHNPSLHDVKLWHLDTNLTIAMAKALEQPQQQVSQLKRLSLTACFSNDDGYFAIANMLKTNRTLTKIQISDIVSADACIELAQGLAHNTTLTELELTYESESDKVNRAMVAMLETNKTIKQLKLYMSYSFENDMSFSAVKGTEYEEAKAATTAVDDWETKIDGFLELNRLGKR